MTTVPLDEPKRQAGLFTQLVRFTVTGGIAAVVDFGSLLIMTHLLGVPDDLAKAVSFVFGTTTAYAINRRWTFQAEPSARRLVAVWICYLATFVLQVGLYALTRPWLMGHMSYPAAQTVSFVIAQGVATVCNFVLQRWVVFRML